MSLIGSIFKNQSPWGSSGPSGGGGNGSGSRREPPNIDELIRNIQNKINKFMPGGKSGGGKPIILGLLIFDLLFNFVFFSSGKDNNLIFLLKICNAVSRRARFTKNIMPAPWQNQGRRR